MDDKQCPSCGFICTKHYVCDKCSKVVCNNCFKPETNDCMHCDLKMAEVLRQKSNSTWMVLDLTKKDGVNETHL